MVPGTEDLDGPVPGAGEQQPGGHRLQQDVAGQLPQVHTAAASQNKRGILIFTVNIPDELLIDLSARVPAAGVHTQVPPGADKVQTEHTNN